jgi:hypothetical protein
MSPATSAAIAFIVMSAAVWLLPIPRDRFDFEDDDAAHNIWALGLWMIRFFFVLGIILLV